ncbi:MAG: hypothetical protein J2P48_20900 [Alphaproteobacteria bacterium]|nr:hypothetical protein [Alphaproteobacteria bacterium]
MTDEEVVEPIMELLVARGMMSRFTLSSCAATHHAPPGIIAVPDFSLARGKGSPLGHEERFHATKGKPFRCPTTMRA